MITTAFAIMAAATIVGLLVGPVRLGASGVLGELFGWLPFVEDGGLDEQQATILWQLRAPRVALACVVGACLGRVGRGLSGGVPQSARRPLPAWCGRRGRARRDHRPGLGGRRIVRRRYPAAAARIVLRRARRGRGRLRARRLDGRAHDDRPRAGRRRRRVVPHRGADLRANSRTPTRSARSTRGSSDGSARRGGTTSLLILPYAAVSIAVLLLHGRLLDVMGLGDDEAESLGLAPARVRLAVIVAASLATAAAVAVAGLIGFVGIIVPHAVRMVVGASQPLDRAAVGALRGGVPRAGRPGRAHGRRARRAADRRRHGGDRRPVLRAAPPAIGGAGMNLELRGVGVDLGGSRGPSGVSLTLPAGGWLGVLGPNGAGKSTLLGRSPGLVEHRGRVRLDGRDAGDHAASGSRAGDRSRGPEADGPRGCHGCRLRVAGAYPAHPLLRIGRAGATARSWPKCSRRSIWWRPRAAAGRFALRRRGPAGLRGAGPRPGTLDAAARRADDLARCRSPAGRARAHRDASPRSKCHRRLGVARSVARRAVRRSPARCSTRGTRSPRACRARSSRSRWCASSSAPRCGSCPSTDLGTCSCRSGAPIRRRHRARAAVTVEPPTAAPETASLQHARSLVLVHTGTARARARRRWASRCAGWPAAGVCWSCSS